MISSGNDRGFGYKYLSLVAMSRTVGASTGLKWQGQGLWILYMTSVGNTGTLDTGYDLLMQ